MYFQPEDFGRIFEALGWGAGRRVVVTIKLEDKERMNEMKLAEALIRVDNDKRCPFCSKSEWGEWQIGIGEGDHKHDEGCPFAIAYDMFSRSVKNKRLK
jgi:hypothetical protein